MDLGLYHSVSLSLYHSLFCSGVPYTHSKVGLNIKFKEVTQTRWNSHPWPKYYPQTFNYPPFLSPLIPLAFPVLGMGSLSLRSSNFSLEIQCALMTRGQKALKMSGAESPTLWCTVTHTHIQSFTQNTHVHTNRWKTGPQNSESEYPWCISSEFQMQALAVDHSWTTADMRWDGRPPHSLPLKKQ